MVVVLLAVLLLGRSALETRLNLAVFDTLQRFAGGAGSARVVVVDASGLQGPDGSLWSSRNLPGLLRAADAAGAAAVVPAHAAPTGIGSRDLQHLAELQKLEQQSDAGSGDGAASALPAGVAELRRQYEEQAHMLAAVEATRTLVLPVSIADPGQGYAQVPECVTRWLRLEGSTDADIGGLLPAVGVVDPGEDLCRGSAGLGYLRTWPDDDGVVRHMHLAVRTSGGVVPSIGLAATLVATGEPPALKVGTGDLLGNHLHIATDPQLTVLRRHYDTTAPGHGFRTWTAADLLGGRVPRGALSGKVVVIGTPRNEAEARVAVPGDPALPSTYVVATSVSNLLEQDFIVRPGWLPWIEGILMLAACILTVVAGPRTRLPLLVMSAGSAAAVLMALEAWLMLDEGIWLRADSIAAFVLASAAVLLATRLPAAVAERAEAARDVRADEVAPPAAAAALPASVAAPVASAGDSEDQLDLAFSVLRQQPGSDRVKDRLYEIALAHVRGRSLAKAERVLRYLAALDPGYRNVTDKLRKLAGLQAGMRQEAAEAAAGRPADPPPAPEEPAAQPESKEPLRRQLGRYAIERVLGRGAMATVYLGNDPKINRKVAIKTIALAEEFSENELESARQQFVREAESAGRLNHPGIITVYDVGDDDNIAYLAMEYFPGKSLAHHAQQGRLLPPKKALDLIARAADALHYAHGQNVVHRDIKPANLLYDGETDRLKITDFGIARLTDSSRTKTGIILGTPSYMSPEQLAGGEVTGQSDIFSLGVTLYQLLTGLPPFRADSIPRLMQCISREPHEPVRSLRPDVPREVDEILDRALAKNPEDRFPSARAMALAIKDCCNKFGAQSAMRA